MYDDYYERTKSKILSEQSTKDEHSTDDEPIYSIKNFAVDSIFLGSVIYLFNTKSEFGVLVFFFAFVIEVMIAAISDLEWFPFSFISNLYDKKHGTSEKSEKIRTVAAITAGVILVVSFFSYVFGLDTHHKEKASNGTYYDMNEWHEGPNGYMYNREGYCDDNGNGHIDSDDIYGNGKDWNWLD